MTDTPQHLHIPLSIQHAAKMMQDMIALQRGLAKDIKSGEIRLTDEDRPLFDTLSLDIDFYLNTIRFLIFSKFTQAIAGYDPRDERIGEPLTEVPDDMTIELITDELDHEPHIHNMKELEAAIKTNHWSDIDSDIAITKEAYTILHEFNPQTKEYSTSESNQASLMRTCSTHSHHSKSYTTCSSGQGASISHRTKMLIRCLRHNFLTQ